MARVGRPVEFPNKKLIGFDQDMLDAIDSWQKSQQVPPTFSDAVRLLVERGLNADDYVRLLDKSIDLIGRLAAGKDLPQATAIELIGILGGYKSRSKNTLEYQQQLQALATMKKDDE